MGKGRVKIVLKELDRFEQHVTRDYECEECIMGSDVPFVALRHKNGSMGFIAYDAILQLKIDTATESPNMGSLFCLREDGHL